MPFPFYNTSFPTPSGKNTITNIAGTSSISGIRDFLLNKNLTPSDFGTEDEFQKLINIQSPKIGEPVTNLESLNGGVITQPNFGPIEYYGLYWKDSITLLNQYQNNSSDSNDLKDTSISITKSPNFGNIEYPTDMYPSKPDTNVDSYGLLAKSTYGEFLKKSTLKNLYLDNDSSVDVSKYIDNPIVTAKYFSTHKASNSKSGYLDEFGNLNLGDGPSKNIIDVLGSALNGSLGIGTSGVVDNFDLRNTIAGRVLGGSGVINDTNLGIIGARQLGLALANNALFNTEQSLLGQLNIQDNLINIAKGDDLSVGRLNYKITVPSSTGGNIIDTTSNILGFTIPRSYLTEGGSIFQDENNNSENILRANKMTENTGKGQTVAMLSNISANILVNSGSNKLRSGYAPAYTNNKGEVQITNFNLYAYDNGEGHLINPLLISDGLIPDINFDRDKKIENFGFRSPENDFIGPDGNSGYDDKNINAIGFIWTSKKEGVLNNIPNASEITGDKKSLLVKTQQLFNSKGMKNMIAVRGEMGKNGTQIETSVVGGGISHGNAVMQASKFTADGVYNGEKTDADSTYCRSWTTLSRYDKVKNLVRNRGLDGRVPYRRHTEGSVLDDNGFVKIAPYSTDKEDPKKYMFSIENLAWNDDYFNLLPIERGPGDLLTGKKGRIMWFPPYNIQFNESNSVNWELNQFIGRGESVYTYSNTERSGNLSFQIIVDHPSYANAFSESKNNSAPDDHYVASFFAGCVEPSELFSNKLTSYELNDIITQTKINPEIQNADKSVKPFDGGFEVYFPNDVYTFVPNYENGLCGTTPIDYTTNPSGNGCGIGYMDGQVTSQKTYNDRYNYGLNGVNNKITIDGVVYNGFTDPGFTEGLRSFLQSDKGKKVVIKITGYASVQGKNSANDILAQKRSETIKTIIKEKVLDFLSPSEQDKRIKIITNTTEISAGCKKNDGDLDTQDSKPCKEARKATISFDIDHTIGLKKNDYVIDKISKITTKITNPFYDETSYFEKLTQEDRFVFDKFRSKIKHFHPAFHSTTPEGLNSRLTFLLQCTRQGKTLENLGANNLAFGRPPVCILRIGDFYNTKIVIDNVSIDYEPLVWDLNPEGIGVQPMIANVSMTFKMIGGSTLRGPLNKLQNALSFNYFANTQVYDPRADYIAKKTSGGSNIGGYDIVNDAKNEIVGKDGKPINGDLNKGVYGGEPVITDVTPDMNQVLSNEIATNNALEEIPQGRLYYVERFDIGNITKTDNDFFVKVKLTIGKRSDNSLVSYDNIVSDFKIITNLFIDGGYKITLKNLNDNSSAYTEILTEDSFKEYCNTLNDGGTLNIPIRNKSNDVGIKDVIGNETFIISLTTYTTTTEEDKFRQNIKLK